ncbi:CDP-glycerol glycerophosphotransferase family protein [Lactobacillus sp. CRM56-3]|uniref:CDP-glycerol glycerophosphotransferase family protein n=2 Tax=Secundilactobacillus folii TaxID=2678357 RepID=A0A7X3C2H9_9LACO|nr:CDP-glycerol glycerophosphotransferase family protein [Secundilactobacillus folii]MTV81254.1 CDP-glycerol glycerophosphotransferase family protein [Secundilactobacillus folii]
MSFGNNLKFILALAAQLPANQHLVVYYRPDVEVEATRLAAYGIQVVVFRDNLHFVFTGVPVLMRSHLIFCDNYYAFLGGLKHPRRAKIVQLWHANGAIKRFGWGDPKTKTRSKADQRRFQNVYNQFDDYVVASDAMGTVFEDSYHVPRSRMKLLGYPRSDRFFSTQWQQAAMNRINRLAPDLANHRVILYAPTYRDSMTFELTAEVKQALVADSNAIVVVKLHPLLQKYEQEFSQVTTAQVRFYPQLSTTDLLMVTETLITDYSSIAFDYSLLPHAHSLLFYMADLEAYQQNPGIQTNYLQWLPTTPLTTPEALKKAILADQPTDFTQFNHYWNTYNDGYATQRVVQYYCHYLES